MASRSRAGSLKSQLDASRTKLKAAEDEIEEVRRASKNALALQAEVTRLERLLSGAGVESSKRSTVIPSWHFFRPAEPVRASFAALNH